MYTTNSMKPRSILAFAELCSVFGIIVHFVLDSIEGDGTNAEARRVVHVARGVFVTAIVVINMVLTLGRPVWFVYKPRLPAQKPAQPSTSMSSYQPPSSSLTSLIVQPWPVVRRL